MASHPTPAVFPDIYVRGRVIHNLYGRGIVTAKNCERKLAAVLFDGEDVARNVLLHNLVKEPAEGFAAAPFARICWPLDRAGERA